MRKFFANFGEEHRNDESREIASARIASNAPQSPPGENHYCTYFEEALGRRAVLVISRRSAAPLHLVGMVRAVSDFNSVYCRKAGRLGAAENAAKKRPETGFRHEPCRANEQEDGIGFTGDDRARFSEPGK